MMSNILNAIVIVALVATFIFGSVGQVTWPEPSAALGVSVAELLPAHN
jgi:hypothetical protein